MSVLMANQTDCGVMSTARSQPVRCVSNGLVNDASVALGGLGRFRQLRVNVVTSHRCSLSRHDAIDPRDGQGRRMRQGDS